MRTKKVEEAINNLNFIVVTDIYDNEVSIDKTKIINEYNQSLGIALDYIRKLEQLPNKIREKIKELEKLNFNNYANEYDNSNEVKYYILKKFKEIIGE